MPYWQFLNSIASICKAFHLGKSRILANSTIKSDQNSDVIGISFEVPSERFETILWRLRNSLIRQSLEALLAIEIAGVSVEIKLFQHEGYNHGFTELAQIAKAAEKRLILKPEREYMNEIMIYSLTQTELSPQEKESLEFMQTNLKISPEKVAFMKAKAIGDLDTLESKEKYFCQSMQAEMNQLRSREESEKMRSKDAWPLLKELSETLGLPVEGLEKTWVEKKREIRSEILRKKQLEKEKEIRNQQIKKEIENRNKYKATLYEFLKRSYYPSEFEQGQIEQVRLFLGVSTAEALMLEASVRDGLFGSIDSGIGLDYNRLRYLLFKGSWEEADRETEYLILKGFSKDMKPLNEDAIKKLNHIDLETIDSLWSRYSNGKFGFRAQHKIYLSLEQLQNDEVRLSEDFQAELAWVHKIPWYLYFLKKRKSYQDLDFSIDAPSGHLPTWRWCCESLGFTYRINSSLVQAILLRLGECLNSD
jgi:hypothetical protein